jgi:hypothetical protein
MSSNNDRFQPVSDSPHATITRRRFGAALAAGAAYAAFTAESIVGQSPVSLEQPELCEMNAVELASQLAQKRVSAREVMSAHLARIEHVNPKLNAIVTLVAEQAMTAAARADEAITRRTPLGFCMGCLSRTRTWLTRRAFGRRTVRRSIATMFRRETRSSSPEFARPAASPWARRTRQSSVPVRRRSILFSEPLGIPTS